MPRALTPSELTVLQLLHEGPTHPYDMQRLVRERRIDDLVPVRRGTLYHAVGRLEERELIEAMETTRAGNRPERTVYRITEAGEDALIARLRELVSDPKREFPEFATALSFLGHLSPADARDQLSLRLTRLRGDVAAVEAQLEDLEDRLPRIYIIEGEYTLAMLRAERDWLGAVVDDLAAGRLTWDRDAHAEHVELRLVEPPPKPDREAG